MNFSPHTVYTSLCHVDVMIRAECRLTNHTVTLTADSYDYSEGNSK